MKLPPYVIAHKNPQWPAVRDRAIADIRSMADAGQDLTVRLDDVARTLDQNAKMWPMLKDFAKQVKWPINGEMQLIADDDWKALLTAAFEQEARMAPGLRGGFVMLGARTSKFGKRTMADFITFMYAEGNDRGVIWSERSKETVERYGRKAA